MTTERSVRTVQLTHDSIAWNRNRAGEDPARALRPAGKAVAGRADARGAGRGARRHRRCAVAAEDAGAAALALDVCARRARLQPDDQRVEGAARGARRALYAGAA